jgi:hypothetical protein
MDPRFPDPTRDELAPMAGMLSTFAIGLSFWAVAFALIRLWLL